MSEKRLLDVCVGKPTNFMQDWVTSSARQEANFRLFDLARLNELCLRSSFDSRKAIDMRVHGPWDFSLTSMVTTHLVVDDSALVRHALGLNLFSDIVDFS